MGVVYQATDPRLKRTVAIKLLPPDLTRDETAKQRFLQEAQAASALDHPNICTIHEINETDDGQLYLVMAHYEGETLKDRITRGPLDLSDAIDIATQVGEGLAKAHAAGIVHRDIKPANLMVTKDGTIKILDFGLAKLTGAEGVTQTATTVGTVAYISPEQARGQQVDHRTDIWSLGVVLYEMLAGTPPFRGENLAAVVHAILERDQPSLGGVSSHAQGAVTRALSKDTAQRYQSVTGLLAQLRALQSGTDAATVAAPTKADVPSIAVLPFTNMSADPEQEYFCEGMAEEIHQRPHFTRGTACGITHLLVPGQGQRFRHGRDWDAPERRGGVGRQCPQGRESSKGDDAVNQREQWLPPVVRAVRPGHGRCVRGARPDHTVGRRETEGQALGGR